MIDRECRRRLRALVGSENLLTEIEDRRCYAYDATNLNYLPEAVAFPATPLEVAQIVRLANKYRFPVVPRGAGTGTTGGALPVQGGLVLVTTRLNHILEIDADNFVAVVEPGVITGHLKAAVEKHGLYYPPDPSSANFSTIGGNVAECAGGPVAVQYGVTRDYVLGLSVVLPTGDLIDTGVRTAKGVVGYDLTRLLIGSEGTLGVITRIILRLVTRPAARQTLLAGFSDLKVAAQAVGRILKARLAPTALEFLDRTTLACVRELLPFTLPEAIQALLLIEVDGHPHDVRERGEQIQAFCRDTGTLLMLAAQNEAEAEKLWRARKSISPASFKLKPHKLSEDVVVPISQIPALVARVEEIARQQDLPILCFGHAGDGNIHVNVMYDAQIEREAAAVQTAVRQVFLTVRELQGTLSGEHGIGITKSAFLRLELSEAAIALSQRLKQAFDPHNIMNPGKIFYSSPELPI
ncbi:MAG: FAD-binding oxidoreductase [Desulfobacteraceae bacterium]